VSVRIEPTKPLFYKKFYCLREALFIKKNKERWDNISQYPSNDTDEIASEFTELVDDLGYAKTFYPHSNIARFLNAEASKRYLAIYKNRKEERNKILMFFKYDVPLTVARHQKIVFGAMFFYLLFFFVGFFSCMKDEHFVREMLGDGYVNMTEKNIADGNPFGVYQTGNGFLVWMGIMVNNIRVSFLYFIEGLGFFFFLAYDQIRSAVTVGAFDYMFYSRGLGGSFVLVVMIHGTLELSALAISAAAGVILGSSWIFPRTMSRLEAFKQGAKDGMKIIVAQVPILALAAFFEGNVTRHPNMPLWMSIPILVGSAAFVIGYFGVWPIILKKRIKKEGLAA
jgi:uncharacterized membrane protein SpoIIM required for sporulation